MSALCAWFLLVMLIGCTQTVNIGVVSSSPKDRLVLAAAAEAAFSSVQHELEQEGKKPPEEEEEWQWDVLVAPVEAYESISIPDQVCAQVAQGVSAIVAHGAPHEIELTADAAARNGVPLLLVTQTSLTVPPETLEQWEVVAMYPQADIFIEACAALCKEKSWSTAVLLHEGPVGPSLVEGIAEAGAETDILARRLPPMTDKSDDEALRNLLLILKKDDHNRFIVWCDESCCNRVLAEAQRVGLLAERHAYILLALDMHTFDLEPYSHGGANITTLQLFDPVGEEVILEAWSEQYLKLLIPEDAKEKEKSEAEKSAKEIMNAPPTMLILTYDVVQHAARVLFRENIYPHTPADQSKPCDPFLYLSYADTLINYLRSEDWDGAAAARRAGYLRVAELTRGGLLEPVAQWNRQSVLWSRNWTDDTPPAPGEMTNRTFTVLISLNPPYVMMKDSSERLTGNDRYEGFGIELIDQLSKLLKFNYTLIEDHSTSYDVMLDKLNQPDVPGDFAITDLTITAKREKYYDFTTPFMNLGISILYKKPSTPDPKLFAFMLPFSTGVWFCLGLAYVGTSLVLYVVGRLCPEEWQNPYPCIEEPEALENQFTLANALWFNLGAVLLQGSEIAPVAYGSRAVASAWWLFALVITSSYTANLATLLAKKGNNVEFSNIQELADNDIGITYGAKLDGATYTFFNNSQDPLYKRMFEHMQNWDMPKSNELGIERVKKAGESFAFFMESSSIEYTIQRECNLTQVGGLLDSKGYGIAMAKGSRYRQALNLALLKLQEAGELRTMKKRWWNEMHGGGACKETEDHESEKLTMKNFLGLFLVLGVGCVLGIFISLVDLMLAARDKSRDPSASYWRRLGDEIRFVFHFQQSEKPVHGLLLPPPSPKTEGIASEHLEEQEEIEEEPERENIGSRMRSPSFQSSAPRSRRRSSLHNASVRLARHTRRESAAQNRVRRKESFDCE